MESYRSHVEVLYHATKCSVFPLARNGVGVSKINSFSTTLVLE